MLDEIINQTEDEIVSPIPGIGETEPPVEQAEQPEAPQPEVPIIEAPVEEEKPIEISQVENPQTETQTPIEDLPKDEPSVVSIPEPLEPKPTESPQPSIAPAPIINVIPSVFKTNSERARELFVKARMAVQLKKKRKLDKIMGLFLLKKRINNSDVRNLLGTTDDTATRYLNILLKEGKIKKEGQSILIYYHKA